MPDCPNCDIGNRRSETYGESTIYGCDNPLCPGYFKPLPQEEKDRLMGIVSLPIEKTEIELLREEVDDLRKELEKKVDK